MITIISASQLIYPENKSLTVPLETGDEDNGNQ